YVSKIEVEREGAPTQPRTALNLQMIEWSTHAVLHFLKTVFSKANWRDRQEEAPLRRPRSFRCRGKAGRLRLCRATVESHPERKSQWAFLPRFGRGFFVCG